MPVRVPTWLLACIFGIFSTGTFAEAASTSSPGPLPTLLDLSGSGGAKLFGTPGGCNGAIRAIARAPSGLIYIGGDFTVCEDVPASRIASYDPARRRFQSLGANERNGVNGAVLALAWSGSNLYAAGTFSAAGAAPASRIARWDGSRWNPLGSGPLNGADNTISALTFLGDDLVAAGDFTRIGNVSANRIAKWNGSDWATFGPDATNGANAGVYALATVGSTLYAAGFFDRMGGEATNRVARWDGARWSSLGIGQSNGLSDTVFSLASSGGALYVAGAFLQAGGQPAQRVARWDGASWAPLGAGLDGVAFALSASGSDLYAGGDFGTAGGRAASRIARWDGTNWNPLGTEEANGVNGGVRAITAAASDVYAGGQFGQATGVPANNIANWNGSIWSASGTGAGNGLNGIVRALTLYRGELYAAGAFTQAGGRTANYIARWNGSIWSALATANGNGVNGEAWALTVLGNNLFVGGAFTQAGGITANRIARWDGNSWFALGSGTDNGVDHFVWALTPYGSDLVAAGAFTTAGGIAANHIARWNGLSWSSFGNGPTNGVNGNVSALVVASGQLFAGGQFTQAGGLFANRIARWDGVTWSNLGTGLNDWVLALTASGTDIYAGGFFTTAGGTPANRIARWNGAAWNPLGIGVDGSGVPYVGAIHSIRTEIYVGGNFLFAGAEPANGLAQWDGTRWKGLYNETARQVVVALTSDQRLLFAGGGGLVQSPLPVLQSRTAGGAPGNRESVNATISGDGRRLAFASDASDLVEGDQNGKRDIFVRNLLTNHIIRASAVIQANGAAAGQSFDSPSLSRDGTEVAFNGSAGQVYLVSENGTALTISRGPNGEPGNGFSGNVQLPGDGGIAVFESGATNLVSLPDGNGPLSDIFMANLVTGAVELVTVGPDGAAANGASFEPSATADGLSIAFSTSATNLVSSPVRKASDSVRQIVLTGLARNGVFVSQNRRTRQLGNGDSTKVRLTPEGRFGVFESLASNLIDDDTNGVSDIYLFEMRDGAVATLERVSVSRFGGQGNGPSRNATISGDGQCVAFETEANNLIELDDNASADIMVKWRVTGEIVRLSRTIDGNQPNGASSRPSIDEDCANIAFASRASNLTPGDSNGVSDVHSVNLRGEPPPSITGPIDEPAFSRYLLPTPEPPNPSCPAGFFIASAEDGPGVGVTPGVFGLEVLLDEPGSRRLDGGLNFGGLVDASQPGFAGFNFANAANEVQRLTFRVTGNPLGAAAGSLPVRIVIERRPDANTSVSVFEASADLTLTSPYSNSIALQPGFYAVTVYVTNGAPGGEADGQFFFELATSFLDRPGGGFQGGAVVGGYHSTNPFGGVSGLAGFCLGSQHTASMRVLSRPTYGSGGALDLKLKLKDAQQRDLVVIPGN